jgi:hypothetical protein
MAAPADRYTTTVVFNGDRLTLCTTCGSLVGDALAHNEWHDGIASAVAAAHHADSMTRPIGGGKVGLS